MRSISFGLLSALIALTAAAPVPDSPPSTLLLELVDDSNLLIGDEELFHHRGGTYRVAPLQRRLSEAEPCEPTDDEAEPGSPEFYFDLFTVIFLICGAGVMAGCQMGFMSFDAVTLRLKEEEGTADEKASASAIQKVLKNRHHLLVSLLLCNAVCNEALPIFLDKLVSPASAILISVTCVLIFGEILPSAVMLGPAQLKIAAVLAPAVGCFMWATSPISVPIARLLDLALGHHEASGFKRNEFKALIRMQKRAVGWAKRANADHADDKKASPPPAPKTPAELRRQLSETLESRKANHAANAAATPSPPANNPLPKPRRDSAGFFKKKEKDQDKAPPPLKKTLRLLMSHWPSSPMTR